MGNAVRHMLIDDLLAQIAQRGIDRGKLDQHFGTVFVVFDHHFDMFQMPQRARNPVYLLFLRFRGVVVAVGMILVIV